MEEIIEKNTKEILDLAHDALEYHPESSNDFFDHDTWSYLVCK